MFPFLQNCFWSSCFPPIGMSSGFSNQRDRDQKGELNHRFWKLVFAKHVLRVRRNWHPTQGCQMVYFHTKIPTLGKILGALEWLIWEYCMSIWYILRPFGIFHVHLVYFTSIWYILRPLGIFCMETIGIFFLVLLCCTKKNLATLHQN
jgi:hypothetical protein